MRVYTLCEKKHGAAGRCPTWPKCCDWWDRPTRDDGMRPWVHLPDSALLPHTAAAKMAMELRLQHTRIVKGLDPKPKPPAPLLSEYIHTYLASPRAKAHRSIQKTIAVLGDFLAHVKDRPLDTISRKMIEDWRDAQAARPSKKTGGTWSENTVQRTYNVIAGLFSYATDDDDDLKALALENPCAKIQKRSGPVAARVLWRPEHDWIIEQLPARYRLPALIARKAGPRRAEILTLTKHDLSEAGWWYPDSKVKLGYLLIRRQKKTDQSSPKDCVPVDYAIVKALWRLMRGRPVTHQFVFGNAHDVPPEPNAWSSLFTRAIRRLGTHHAIDVHGICLHGGRHTATGKMQDARGVNPHTAQRMGGWANLAQVAGYTRMPDASMKLAAAQLARSYKPKAPPRRKTASK